MGLRAVKYESTYNPKKNYSKKIVKKNRYILKEDIPYISIIVVALCITGILYCSLNASISLRKNEINSLKSEISKVKENNDIKYNELKTNINIDRIKEISLNQNGMIYENEEVSVQNDERNVIEEGEVSLVEENVIEGEFSSETASNNTAIDNSSTEFVEQNEAEIVNFSSEDSSYSENTIEEKLE